MTTNLLSILLAAFLMVAAPEGSKFEPSEAQRVLKITSHNIVKSYQISNDEVLLVCEGTKGAPGYQEGRKLFFMWDNGDGYNFDFQSTPKTDAYNNEPVFYKFDDGSVLIFTEDGNGGSTKGFYTHLVKNDKCQEIGYAAVSDDQGGSVFDQATISGRDGKYTLSFTDMIIGDTKAEKPKSVKGKDVKIIITKEGVTVNMDD